MEILDGQDSTRQDRGMLASLPSTGLRHLRLDLKKLLVRHDNRSSGSVTPEPMCEQWEWRMAARCRVVGGMNSTGQLFGWAIDALIPQLQGRGSGSGARSLEGRS